MRPSLWPALIRTPWRINQEIRFSSRTLFHFYLIDIMISELYTNSSSDHILLLLWTISFIIYRRSAGRRDSIIYLILSSCRFDYRSNKLLCSLLIMLRPYWLCATYHRSVMNRRLFRLKIAEDYHYNYQQQPPVSPLLLLFILFLDDTFFWFSHRYVSRII